MSMKLIGSENIERRCTYLNSIINKVPVVLDEGPLTITAAMANNVKHKDSYALCTQRCPKLARRWTVAEMQ
jgi:hypothetical protein